MIKFKRIIEENIETRYFRFKVKGYDTIYTAIYSDCIGSDRVLVFWVKKNGEYKEVLYAIQDVESNIRKGVWEIVEVLDGKHEN